MNGKGKVIVGAVVVLVGCLFFKFYGNGELAGEPGAWQVETSPNGKRGNLESGSGANSSRGQRSTRNQSNYNEWISDFWKPKLSVEQIDRYLDRVGRTPSALVFAMSIHWSPELMAELKKHTNDPLAVAYIASKSRDPSERLIWSEKLAKLEPRNSLGGLLKASALAELGREDESRLALKSATEIGKLDFHQAEVEKHYEGISADVGADAVNLQYLASGSSVAGDLSSATAAQFSERRFSSSEDIAEFRKAFELTKSLKESNPAYWSTTIRLQSIGSRLLKGADKALAESPEGKDLARLITEANLELPEEGKRQEFMMENWSDKERLARIGGVVRTQGWPKAEDLKNY